MLSDLQKKTAQAVVNIFETGSMRGDYASVVFHPKDAGHLTYGRSQTTLASGNLFLLVDAYCRAQGAAQAPALGGYLPALQACDVALDTDMALRATLKAAGGDPVMRQCQDSFFDRVYWAPAATRAAALGIGSALGTTVVYDSIVHGSFERIRDQVTAAIGAPNVAGEQTWIARYVDERRRWLAGFDPAKSLLPRTVYRMDEIKKLLDAQKWSLPLPVKVRGVEITEAALTGAPLPARSVEETILASADETRPLRLRQPPLEGDDVRDLQRALAAAGFPVAVDGVFGANTNQAVRSCQAARGLQVDGIVGPATRAVLDL